MIVGHRAGRVANRGSHLYVWRGVYWHHGIAVGGEWLIEFGSGLLGGDAHYVRVADFAQGGVVRQLRHADGLPPALVARRAETQLGRRGFDVTKANCEHFATWCATGRWESKQVQLVGILAAVAGAMALLSPAGQRLLAKAV